jgi:hypothetical protein
MSQVQILSPRFFRRPGEKIEQWSTLHEAGSQEFLHDPVKQTLLIAVLVWPLFVAATWAADWPQWRGPTRDGAWNERGVLKTFPPSGLKIRWRTSV